MSARTTSAEHAAILRPARRRRQIVCEAVVWRRSDFRESSRIVTLVTREHGKIRALAKGAHRPDSPFLGRLDYLNQVDARLAAPQSGLRLLVSATLANEPRGLRQPRRFLAASYLAELCDFAWLDERADPELFDLMLGGLTLLERCPEPAIPQVVLGLELRFLRHCGTLPLLMRCSQCGASLAAGAHRPPQAGGLFCRRHAPTGSRVVEGASLSWLHRLDELPGRAWPGEPPPPNARQVADLLGAWIGAAMERWPRLRRSVFDVGGS